MEVEGLTPQAVQGKSLAEIERLPVLLGNRKLPLAELFECSGGADDGAIELEGDLSGVHWIGAGMSGGVVRVLGDAGRHLGSGMRAGRIEVHGSVGDWAGAEMRGGLLNIAQNAGRNLGAAYRGSPRGMTGGAIVVGGDAGDETATSMRRGWIAIGGAVGDLAAFNMRAGAVVVAGGCGRRPGAGMRRGSLICLTARPPLLPTFRQACRYRPDVLLLMAGILRREGFRFADALTDRAFDLFHGDFLAGGRGEVFLPAA